jgi:hypothetical protein
MIKNIKKRNSHFIEEKDLNGIFSLVRKSVGFIPKKRWFDEFDRCLKTAYDWLMHCRERYKKDGDKYFASMWKKMGSNAWFDNADDLYNILEKLITNNREEWERDNLTYSIE